LSISARKKIWIRLVTLVNPKFEKFLKECHAPPATEDGNTELLKILGSGVQANKCCGGSVNISFGSGSTNP
jgi:hypothetical protein